MYVSFAVPTEVRKLVKGNVRGFELRENRKLCTKESGRMEHTTKWGKGRENKTEDEVQGGITNTKDLLTLI